MENESFRRKAANQSWYVDSGFNRGADPEQLLDIGYELPEQWAEEQAKASETAAHRRIGAPVCADCLQVIPCGVHTVKRPDGTIETVGH